MQLKILKRKILPLIKKIRPSYSIDRKKQKNYICE